MKLRNPDMISLFIDGMARADAPECGDARVELRMAEGALQVLLTADSSPVRYVRLRWNFAAGEAPQAPVRVLGDHWERGYGDLEWRGIVPQRCMPWVCAAATGSDSQPDNAGREVMCYGVRVRPGALCFWQYDDAGVTLWLDVRNGGSGVLLGGRTLCAAQVVMAEYRDMSAFRALRDFYRSLCSDAVLPDKPVYGFNNWYYAYGKSSHGEILHDARELSGLCEGLDNRPFMVIDDGWQPHSTDAPWDRGNELFPDMKGLADGIKALNVRPGIWIRYLIDSFREAGLPDDARLSRDNKYLDPSHPAVRQYVRDCTRLLTDWGYQLIKHDYSTYDLFGDWGFNRQQTLTDDGWCFYDRTKTSAEIVNDFYRDIYEAADGRALILGCNVIGHLTAGLAHLNRTGDDTSGREWERTRRMGVNTLAFRMLHDKAFFGADADCAPFTPALDQKMGLRWLDILAKSGTCLFVSPQPGALDDEGMAALKAALAVNSVQTDVLEPVDWMETVCPRVYMLNGKRVEYDWYEPDGAEGVNI